MRLALAQLNPLIGDLQGNGASILAACIKATKQKVDLLITPELSLWGYPPRDLLLNQQLLAQQKEILDELSKTLGIEAPNLKVLIGIAEPTPDLQLPNLYNSAALIENSAWKVVAQKQLLPTYDVFDEKRYFRPSQTPGIVDLKVANKNWRLGITICEDLWVEEELQGNRTAGPDPIEKLIPEKLDLLINLSASPFSHNKESLRQKLALKAVKRVNCPLVYLNQVGGNDELVFDGASFVVNSHGKLVFKLPSCREEMAIWDQTSQSTPLPFNSSTPEEKLFHALVLGLRDYAIKCGFTKVILGLSGGIDSALVAIIAAAALGAKKVTAVMMPSPWSSEGSSKDALKLIKRIGLKQCTIPINELMKVYESALTKSLNQPPKGITAENLQSRIRGTLLMAIANQQGQLLLSTGNKSELAVGYCTLYGDMNGGLSVLGDLYKTSVFDICRWLDSSQSKKCREELGLPMTGELISAEILLKPPSAELRPGQLDTDSLPEYSLLDPILKALIEEQIDPKELVKSGHNEALISKVQTLLQKAEFKRRQAPPLLKLSNKAFGTGWRKPIATK